MLKILFSNQLYLGLSQALVAALAAMVVVLLARKRGIHLERDTLIAMVRGIVQIVAGGPTRRRDRLLEPRLATS